jgi:hypothetical protein
VPSPTRYAKDGINDHVVNGAEAVNPEHRETKVAFRYRLEVPAGETATIELRLAEDADPTPEAFDVVMTLRAQEADEFYAALTPAGTSEDEALVLRQALAGMLWSKQFYHYDVQRWLEGDPGGPPPPETRCSGRNHDWSHLNNLDVISMPDKWEYPWYAAWDLAVMLPCGSTRITRRLPCWQIVSRPSGSDVSSFDPGWVKRPISVPV